MTSHLATKSSSRDTSETGLSLPLPSSLQTPLGHSYLGCHAYVAHHPLPVVCKEVITSVRLQFEERKEDRKSCNSQFGFARYMSSSLTSSTDKGGWSIRPHLCSHSSPSKPPGWPMTLTSRFAPSIISINGYGLTWNVSERGPDEPLTNQALARTLATAGP